MTGAKKKKKKFPRIIKYIVVHCSETQGHIHTGKLSLEATAVDHLRVYLTHHFHHIT